MGNKQSVQELFNKLPYPTVTERAWRHLRIPDYSQVDQNIIKHRTEYNNRSDAVITHTPHRHFEAELANDKFYLLNQAFQPRAQAITIPQNVRDAFVHQNTIVESSGTVLATTTITVNESSDLFFMEEFDNAQNKNCISSVTHIVVAKDARITYLSKLALNPHTDHHHYCIVSVKEGGSFHSMTLATNSRLTHAHLTVHLEGPYASATMHGLTIGLSENQVVHTTLQDHQSAFTTSDLDFRTILADQSHHYYHGLIRVGEKAHRSNAYQKNSNTLLSELAKTSSSPKLEILTDDVRCTHGATSGPLDDEQLWYMQSRGIADRQAKMMLLHGMCDPLIKSLHNTSAELMVASHIDQSLASII